MHQGYGEAPASGLDARPRALTADARAEIEALIDDDQKISAIKRYREATGAGLTQAKDAVEHWQR